MSDGNDPWPEDDTEGLDGQRTRVRKAATAFRTISEVADELHIPQHVLRFWEQRFPQVRPLKRGGGRRYYRPEDVELLRRISSLLYVQGYTIKGVQRLLRDGGTGDGDSVEPDELPFDPPVPRPVSLARPLPKPGPQPPPQPAPPSPSIRGGASASRPAGSGRATLDAVLDELLALREALQRLR